MESPEAFEQQIHRIHELPERSQFPIQTTRHSSARSTSPFAGTANSRQSNADYREGDKT